MALIADNKKITEQVYLIEIEGKFKGKAGQFYMIKIGEYPLLRRPISIFEITDRTIKFLYRIEGEGTQLLSQRIKGEQIDIQGPYGNGFPGIEGKIALVGGGMGVAPLYETCKKLKENSTFTVVDLYLGFSDEVFLKDQWDKIANSFFYDVGGYITDYIDVSKYDAVLTCGPDIMMKKLTQAGKESGVKVYVSKESRMACGIGACLSCTCKTTKGNKKTCKDGPVFLGEEIYDV